MLNRRSLATLLAVLVVSLALIGPVLAKPFGPPPPDPPEPPAAVEGVYVTSEDNQNNAGTDSPDNDMGYAPPFWVCTGGETEPVEFNIAVDADICSGGELGLAVFDLEAGVHQVYLNGDLLGTLPDAAGLWAKVLFQVPQSSLVEQGTNLVKIDLGGEDCGMVAWGAIAVEPCEEEFVPEPGSILLLGSGLAGLAGYATLRRRSGQALRRRTRE